MPGATGLSTDRLRGRNAQMGETDMRITMLAAAAALLCSIATPASAQQPATGIVSIYHVAPGHQVMFLKWLAEQERKLAEQRWVRNLWDE